MKDPDTLLPYLSGDELAALSFRAIVHDLTGDLDRIAAAIPAREIQPYQARLQGCYRLAGLYGVEHHSLRTKLVACTALRIIHGSAGDFSQAQASQDARVQWQSCLNALESALREVCEAHGVDADSVRELADAAPSDADDTAPDLAYGEYIVRALTAAIGS